jgi:hypothetical protein
MTVDERIRILREVVAPVGGAYLVVVAMLIAYRRDPRRRRTEGVPGRRGEPVRGRDEWASLTRYVMGMTVGGYLVFLGIVVTFYFVLGGEDRSFVLQALREGSVLTFGMVVPAFLLISLLYGLARRRTRPPGSLTDHGGRAAPPGERKRPA